FSCCFITQLVTGDTPIRLELAYPLGLARHVFGNPIAVSTGSGELIFPRYLNHGEPISSGIIIGSSFRARCKRGREVKVFSGRSLDFGRVNQPITAHPNVIVCLWEVWQDISSTIVGYDDLDESR